MTAEIATVLSALGLACAWHGLVTIPRQKREILRLLALYPGSHARHLAQMSTARGLFFKLLRPGNMYVALGLLIEEELVTYRERPHIGTNLPVRMHYLTEPPEWNKQP